MRKTLLLLCLALEAVPWVSARAGSVEAPRPDDAALLVGIRQAINDSHFTSPIEVTELFSAPSNSSNPWMLCIRSGQSDETRRIGYSAFFNEQYVQSRYSVFTTTAARSSITRSLIPRRYLRRRDRRPFRRSVIAHKQNDAGTKIPAPPGARRGEASNLNPRRCA